MGWFGKNKEKEERDRLFRAVKEGAERGNMGIISSAFISIQQQGLMKDPEASFLLESAITTMSKRSVQEGLGLAMWAYHIAEQPLIPALVSKTLSLIGRADRADMKTMATVAAAANLAASKTAPGSAEHTEARRAWLAAVDTLAARKDGLDYAFAAASNAAIGNERYLPLRKDAIQKWDDIVMNLAKTDRRTALAEAFRMASGYENFGSEAAEIRARASSVKNRIMQMKP